MCGPHAVGTLFKSFAFDCLFLCSGTIEDGYSVPPVMVKRVIPEGLADSHGVMVGDLLDKVRTCAGPVLPLC